jgi:predicted dinucleotide-binding enzyme
MRNLIFVLLAGALLQSAQAAAPVANEMPAIAIIGTGSVGSALGVSWGGLGHPIIYGSREPESAATQELVARSGNARAVSSQEVAAHADVIVLALPFSAALALVPKLGSLDGKILIDPMNSLDFDGKSARVSVSETLLAEQIQALAPTAHVVKALNAIGASNMMPGRDFSGPISVPIAGDDAAAKAQVAQLIESLGLDVTDVGPLFNARFVEAMAPLYVYMNFFARPPGGFEYAISQK